MNRNTGFLLRAVSASWTVLALTQAASHAAEWHVAPQGDDGNPGTSAKPFHSIQKAADAMQPGDACFLHAGTYRESVAIKNGGAEGKPVRFVAQPGDKVTISGTELFAGKWTAYKGSIYQAKTDLKFDQLFVDGRMMMEARWPNTTIDDILTRKGWAPVEKGSVYGRIKDSKLAATGVDWTGATSVLNIAHQFFTWNRPVLKHSKGADTFEYAADMGQQLDIMSKQKAVWEDDYYYLCGKLEALDAPEEWFLDREAGVLYLWAPDGKSPSAYTVDVEQRDYALQAQALDYIELTGIHFFATTFRFENCNDCVIDGCRFMYPSYGQGAPDRAKPPKPVGATSLTGARNIIRNCSLAYASNGGFKVGGAHNLVENCLVHDVCWSGNLGHTGIAMGPTKELTEGGNIVRRCTVYNCGNVCIHMSGAPNGVVEYCHAHDGGMLCKDVALIYTQLPAIQGTEFRYNWVHDNHAESGALGIRGDDQTRGLSVHHNVVWNCRRDGIVVKGDFNKVYNNTCFANGASDIRKDSGPEPKKVWREQFPLLPAQNTHSLIINNIAHVIVADKKYENRPINGDATNNYREADPPLAAPESLDFRPRDGSALVDGGRVVAGLTDRFQGAGPDIGAYELGGEVWRPGCQGVDDYRVPTTTELRYHPEFAEASGAASRPNARPTGPNLLKHGDFEGEDLKPWFTKSNEGELKPGQSVERVGEGQDGGWCVKIQCLDPALMKEGIVKWIHALDKSVGPGLYVLAYDIRVENLNPQSANGMFCGYIRTVTGPGAGANAGQNDYAIHDSNLAWTRRECVIEIPAGAYGGFLALQLHQATGTVWVDNVSLKRGKG
ncbi:MAG: right-handed parallel beta-helix repeat-containing protein [Candidatus Sumerlaeota bacterium]|nr:right-handed parallel beta-helix repeat-containing protein [Candidatus Sumerlaeota bacterium]